MDKKYEDFIFGSRDGIARGTKVEKLPDGNLSDAQRDLLEDAEKIYCLVTLRDITDKEGNRSWIKRLEGRCDEEQIKLIKETYKDYL